MGLKWCWGNDSHTCKRMTSVSLTLCKNENLSARPETPTLLEERWPSPLRHRGKPWLPAKHSSSTGNHSQNWQMRVHEIKKLLHCKAISRGRDHLYSMEKKIFARDVSDGINMSTLSRIPKIQYNLQAVLVQGLSSACHCYPLSSQVCSSPTREKSTHHQQKAASELFCLKVLPQIYTDHCAHLPQIRTELWGWEGKEMCLAINMLWKPRERSWMWGLRHLDPCGNLLESQRVNMSKVHNAKETL